MATPDIPSTRTALVKTAPGQAVITTQPMPVPEPGYMLVQTKAVALNPADWTDIDHVGNETSPSTTTGFSLGQSRYEGCVTGLDYAGIVVLVTPREETDSSSASDASNPHLKSFHPGDRVCGSAYGCNVLHPEQGAFSDYIIVKTDLQMHIPQHMSFEGASSLGVGVLSAGMGLFRVSKFGIPHHLWTDDDNDSPNENQKWILVYGGSTASGSVAIQFAKLAGYKVVTTCSPRNFELVKGFGADAVFDYNNPEISSLIKTATSDTLRFVYDTVGTDQTAEICVNSLASSINNDSEDRDPALYIPLLDPKLPATTPVAVEKRAFLGYTCWGSDIYFGGSIIPAVPADYQFAIEMTHLAETLLAKGKLRNHRITVNENSSQKGGLEGVLMGLDILRKGAVSGRKLVYTM